MADIQPPGRLVTALSEAQKVTNMDRKRLFFGYLATQDAINSEIRMSDKSHFWRHDAQKRGTYANHRPTPPRRANRGMASGPRAGRDKKTMGDVS